RGSTHAQMECPGGSRSLYRRVVECSPPLQEVFPSHKRPVGVRWRMDATSSRLTQRLRVYPRARRGSVWADHGLSAHGAPGVSGDVALPEASDPPAWTSRDDRH